MTRKHDYIASNQRSGNGEESIVDSVANQEHKKQRPHVTLIDIAAR
jgi:hypothetical protein